MHQHRRSWLLATENHPDLIADRIPWFRFGSGPHLLGLLNGPLIFDSGEADNSFLFRCQERFFVYAALNGIRPICFAMDRRHRDDYLDLVEKMREGLRAVARRTGIQLPGAADPFFVPLDPDSLEVFVADWFDEQEVPENYALVMNQASPTAARLVRQTDQLLSRRGVSILSGADAGALEQTGRLALGFHDKAEYVRLAQERPGGLPDHCRTVVIDLSEFLNLTGWDALAAMFRGRFSSVPDVLFVKSSGDSGGNLTARITAENAHAKLRELQQQVKGSVSPPGRASIEALRGDIDLSPTMRNRNWTDERLADWLEAQVARRQGLSVLIQECVDGGSTAASASVGIICSTRSDGLFAATQIYRDEEKRHFLGSFVSEVQSARILTPEFAQSLHALKNLFAERGYEGPLGFDARRTSEGAWNMIYDCNPRLTAVLPGLTVFRYLRAQGLPCESVFGAGYRGEWNGCSVETWLDRLETAGILYGIHRSAGILPLPNAARPNGCDLLLVNATPPDAVPLLQAAAGDNAASRGLFF